MRKLKSNKGFTLVEMLACVITLLLIGMICTTGMNFALNSYQRSVFESDSQMLEDTLNMYIGDILRHATSIETEIQEPDETGSKKVVSFTNAEYQIYEGRIEVPEKTDDVGGNFLVYESKNGQGNLLAGEMVYASTLYVEKFVLKYNENTGVFTGYYIIKSTILSDVSRECTFTYRTIAEY